MVLYLLVLLAFSVSAHPACSPANSSRSVADELCCAADLWLPGACERAEPGVRRGGYVREDWRPHLPVTKRPPPRSAKEFAPILLKERYFRAAVQIPS